MRFVIWRKETDGKWHRRVGRYGSHKAAQDAITNLPRGDYLAVPETRDPNTPVRRKPA